MEQEPQNPDYQDQSQQDEADYEDHLFTVHDAMMLAAEEVEVPPGMNPATYRITDETKQVANQICAQHGTTLSQFIRKCCEGLVEDYAGKQAED